jgi:hypothetical protein
VKKKNEDKSYTPYFTVVINGRRFENYEGSVDWFAKCTETVTGLCVVDVGVLLKIMGMQIDFDIIN